MVRGAGVAVAEGATEAGTETEEAGGEVSKRVGQEGVANPVKDSKLWDASISRVVEKNTELVSVMLP